MSYEMARLFYAIIIFWATWAVFAEDPPAVHPFGNTPKEREDAVPGRIELSDGSTESGRIFLTRDAKLKIYDEKLERQREVPLTAVKQIDCKIKKEWMEKEWMFKETASDEKIYTGKNYPAREYLHSITLNDGQTITGPLSAIVYLHPKKEKAPPGEYGNQSVNDSEPKRFLLNKRNKGEPGQSLESLVYVQRIVFGKEAMEEGPKQMKKNTTKLQTNKTSES